MPDQATPTVEDQKQTEEVTFVSRARKPEDVSPEEPGQIPPLRYIVPLGPREIVTHMIGLQRQISDLAQRLDLTEQEMGRQAEEIPEHNKPTKQTPAQKKADEKKAAQSESQE